MFKATIELEQNITPKLRPISLQIFSEMSFYRDSARQF